MQISYEEVNIWINSYHLQMKQLVFLSFGVCGKRKNIAISPFSFDWRGDWDKTVAASLRNGNKGVLPVRSSLPSWKTLISAKSANYFECVPDRVRIKVRPGRFWPAGPRKIPNAETNWTLSQSEEEPIQRRTRNSSEEDQRNELVRGFAAVSGRPNLKFRNADGLLSPT